MKQKLKIWIIIPSYNPTYKMVELVKEIYKYNKNIIVIDDGSEKQFNKYFNQIEKECIILKNNINQGKGEALKKGFKYILNRKEDFLGVVTADADGQHEAKDIIKVENMLKQNKDKIILGIRNFNEKNVPLLNKIINKIMCSWNKKKYGYDIKDTQTGLRGIPSKYIKQFIKIKGNRYEYEFNMLKYIQSKNILVEQIQIKTIYSKKIKSNYRKIYDTIKFIKC